MPLWKIAWRSIQQRALASALTAVSMALGVMLVVAVLVIYSVVHQAFNRGAACNLIVGPNKGSNLDLVLNSVFYVGKPETTFPYAVYKALDYGEIGGGKVELLVPICLGDNYEDYSVVGTTANMFDKLHYYIGDQPNSYEFAEGHNFGEGEQHYLDAVIGATVARKTTLKLGDRFRPTHDAGGKADNDHPQFTIVGVLKPTGTPNDNALFVNIEGFWRVGGHTPGHARESAEHHHDHEIRDEDKKPSAILVCTSGDWQSTNSTDLAREINNGKEARAAIPAKEISRLFEKIVGNIELVLLLFAMMIVLVAGIGIMVSIYNSMNDRRHEIAIMRALGASRSTVMTVILLESILLSLGGGLLGLGLGHGILAAAGPWIADKVNLPVALLQFDWKELWLIPALIGLASVVGYMPAVAAYRTDVGKSLQANP